MASITIILNGEHRELPETMTLSKLIDHFELPRQRIAVEHNAVVIRRADWPATVVSDLDKIEVVHFVGGG